MVEKTEKHGWVFRYIFEVKRPRSDDGCSDEQMKTGCCNRVFLHKEVLKFTLENIRFEIFIRYSSRYVKSAGKRSEAR